MFKDSKNFQMNMRSIMILIAFVSVIFAACITPASAATITVGSSGANHATIQAAINAANAGDTIYVYNGTYNENVDVNKTVTLQGEGSDVVNVIAALNSDYVFDVQVDYVNISGFNVSGATDNYKAGFYLNNKDTNISNNIVSGNYYGIYLYSSSNSTLTSNTASNNVYGIYLSSSSNSTLTNNTASNNVYGIYLYSSSNSTLMSNTASNNTQYGIYLSYSSNSTLTNNTASNNAQCGIYLSYSSNNTLTSNTMNGNTYNFRLYGNSESHFDNQINTTNLVDGKPIYYVRNATNTAYNSSTNVGTFYLINCVNITLTDLNLTTNYDGIYLWNTTDSNIQNVNASNNVYGISLFISSNNTLTSNTASNNTDYGIRLLDSSTNTLTSNTASNNTKDGISLYSLSNYNTLTSNTASNNTYCGISLEKRSSNNTLTSNTASNNTYCGIDLYSSSNNNTLTSNTASNNTLYGIRLSSSSNNTIYNNYFSNTYNAYDNDNNIWNTTKTAGTNIIGKSYLGGNYWSDYTGADTDGDKLGDTLSPYNSSGNITNGGDYHPLIYTTTDQSSTPSPPTDDSSGHVNLPTPLPENVVNNEVKGTIFSEPVTSADLKFDKGYITLVTVDAKDTISEVMVTIQELKSKPSEIKVAPPSGAVHTYYNINLERIGDNDLEGATIKFKAEKKWIAENGGDRNAVVVMRYHDDWMALETKPIGEDDKYVFFSARTPGFSTFAITMKLDEEVAPVEVQTSEPVVEEVVDEPLPKPEPQEETSYWWLILVMAAIAGVVFFVYKNKKDESEK